MGYISKVAIAIKNSVEIDSKVLEELDNNFSYKHVIGDKIYWYENLIKWYSDFEEVESITNFLANLDEEDYGFVHVGEDIDDIETSGCIGKFEIYPYSAISLPFKIRDVCSDDFSNVDENPEDFFELDTK